MPGDTMPDVRITHIGGPTALIEVGSLRLLTDPTFDAPGRRYTFGWGSGSRKTAGPAIAAADLPAIDAVLLTHDHHGDNLDDAGRALLPTTGTVLTTTAGAHRLGGNAVGLAPWQSISIGHGDPHIEVTATPARHGPPLSRPITGDVVGFALRWPGQRHGALWISGDTVLYDGVRGAVERFRIGTALLHLGAVRFPITGPIRYTMTARKAVALCRLARAHTVIPIHYEGWRHFRQGRDVIEREFGRAPDEIRRSIRWLTPGVAADIAA
jgi:L-ascorbate metabolism protein UlaG (beta-lactamase superfamily)